ncbi:MAG: N-acetylmuramoyl-L-alanine amidase [Bacteroidota bacterium]
MKIANKIKVALVVVACAISFTGFAQSKKFKVTLDAGHGGHDFGASYHGHVEKKISLAVVLKVGKILEEQYNVDVNYTRKTDVFIDLIERANIANRVDANIFVSIHCNANKNISASGTETYVMGLSKSASSLSVAKSENEVVTMEKDYKQKYDGYNPNSPESMIGISLIAEEYLENSIALAGKVEDAFGKIGKKIRAGGVKQAPFMVLHKAYMPRVLIEMGFISNIEEGEDLDSEDGQEDIASAIATAIMSYKKEYYGNGNTSEESDVQKPSEILKQTAKETTNTNVKALTNEITPDKNTTSAGTVFKIQISVSNRKLDLIPSNFNGLDNLSVFKGNTNYRYMYQETSSYDDAKKYLKDAKERGFNSAFIIAFRDGKSITVQEALKQ